MNSLLNHHLHSRDRELNEVYFAESIRTFAFSLLTIFIPIYLYNLGYSLRAILVYFTFYYLFSSLSEYISGRLVSRYGANHVMALSFPSMAASLVFLLTLSTFHWPLLLLAVTMAFSNGLFWVPYDDNFSKAKHKKTAGKEVGKAVILVAVFGALGPVTGGIIADEFGVNVLVFITIVLLSLVAIPIFGQRDIIPKKPLKMKSFFTKNNIRNAVAYGGYGFEDNASKVIWPFFIFLIVGSYKEVGFIATLSLLVAVAVTIFVGKLADKYSKERVLKLGTMFNFTTSAGRIAVGSANLAYMASLFSAVAHIFVLIPFVSIFFMNADRDKRTEYVVGMEMGTDFIRAIYFLLLVIATFFFANILVLSIGIALGALGVFFTLLINNHQGEEAKRIRVHKEIIKARV